MLIGIFYIPFMATNEEDQNESSLQTSPPAVFSAQEGFLSLVLELDHDQSYFKHHRCTKPLKRPPN